MPDFQFSNIEKIILTLGTIGCLGSFGYEVWRRFKIVLKGRESLPFDRLGVRCWRVIREVLFHEKVMGGRFWPGLMHGLVFWGDRKSVV